MTTDSPIPQPDAHRKTRRVFLFKDTFPYRAVGFFNLGYNRANDV